MDNATTGSVSFDNVCRLCLASDEPKLSIFQGDYASMVPLALKIQDCLSIQISTGDKLSTLICEICNKNVNQWHSYKESCLKVQDKLRQWQLQQPIQSIPLSVTIKQEPVDLEFDSDQNGVLMDSPISSHEHSGQGTDLTTMRDTELHLASDRYANKIVRNELTSKRKTKSLGSVALSSGVSAEYDKPQMRVRQDLTSIEIKTESIEDEYDSSFEVESVVGGEIVPNPVAIGTANEDRIMEADSTQRSNSSVLRRKRKVRRGPYTHIRNRQKSYKKKCAFCQIYLHSKYSYAKHMERFHTWSEDSSHGLSTKFQNPLRTKNGNDAEDSSTREFVGVTSCQTGERADNPQAYEKDIGVEMIEDVEDEINNMDTNSDTPLSQLQHTIIGQLKTYSCYSCEIVFPDRRSTLNHLRQHMPDLRPFTCVACLNQFPNQPAYKHHCATSYECALKIASVEPRSGTEKYFACNMCSKSTANRKELLNHVAEHAEKSHHGQEPHDKPSRPSFSDDLPPASSQWPSLPGPYENGDPAYNHACDYCGNIYKRRRNMLVHRELCSKLPVDARICYTCVRCRMTFLQFYKFYNHLGTVHGTTDIVCSKCRKEFKTTSEYLTHDDKYHRNRNATENPVDRTDTTGAKPPPASFESPLKDWNAFEAEVHANEARISRQKYSCALCGQEFPTRTELGEHRNLHLKVKIYSCVICRSMFSSAGALEVHMKDHGIEDPVEQSAHTSCVEYEGTEDTKDPNLVNALNPEDPDAEDKQCKICKKQYSSVANKNRHVSNVHAWKLNDRTCPRCDKQFKSDAKYAQHMATEHGDSATGSIRCTDCPQTFVNRANFILHYKVRHDPSRTLHGPHECEICGKEFKQRYSLQIHRGWHNRRSKRMIIDQTASDRDGGTSLVPRTYEAGGVGGRHSTPAASSGGVHDATSPTSKPARARKSFPLSKGGKSAAHLRCQVCDHAFHDVTELRSHLWDVHCARAKNEKEFTTNDLQCELCTNILPDKASFEKHVKWHKANPILGSSGNATTRKGRYQTANEKITYPCEFCGNRYTSQAHLLNHMKLHRDSTVATKRYQATAKTSVSASALTPIPTSTPAPATATATAPSEYPCNVCRKVFNTPMNLHKHRQRHFVKSGDRKKRSLLQKSNFKCEPCNRYYTSQMSLRFHETNACPYRDQSVAVPVGKRRKHDATAVDGEVPASRIAMANNNTSRSGYGAAKPSFGVSIGWRTKKMVKCRICQKSFLGKNFLYKHKLHDHPEHTWQGVQPDEVKIMYACEICGKEFPGEINLKLHFAAVHKDYKSHACNICLTICNNPVALKTHMDKHSVCKYHCNLCRQPFLSRAAIMSHIGGRHAEVYPEIESDRTKLFTDLTIPVEPIDRKPAMGVGGVTFDCDRCRRSFETSRGMKMHMYKRHSMRS